MQFTMLVRRPIEINLLLIFRHICQHEEDTQVPREWLRSSES